MLIAYESFRLSEKPHKRLPEIRLSIKKLWRKITFKDYMTEFGLSENASEEERKKAKKEWRKLYMKQKYNEWKNKVVRQPLTFTKSEHEIIRQAAEQSQLKTSEFCKRQLLASLDGKQVDIAIERQLESLELKISMVLNDLRRIGNNINQVARATNRTGFVSDLQQKILEEETEMLQSLETLQCLKDGLRALDTW